VTSRRHWHLVSVSETCAPRHRRCGYRHVWSRHVTRDRVPHQCFVSVEVRREAGRRPRTSNVQTPISMDKRPDNQNNNCPEQQSQPNRDEYTDRGCKVIITAARRSHGRLGVRQRIFRFLSRRAQRLPAQKSDKEAVGIGTSPRPAAIGSCICDSKFVVMFGIGTHQISFVKAWSINSCLCQRVGIYPFLAG
jgi:hypothetical protein